jgi:hypothetical protein
MAGISEYGVIIAKSCGEGRVKRVRACSGGGTASGDRCLCGGWDAERKDVIGQGNAIFY